MKPAGGIGDPAARIGELHPYHPAVGSIPYPFHQPLALQFIDSDGHGADSHQRDSRQFRHRTVPALPDGVQYVHLRHGDGFIQTCTKGTLFHLENGVKGIHQQTV